MHLYNYNIKQYLYGFQFYIPDCMIDDFSVYIRRYWYKIGPELIGVIMESALRLERHHWIIEFMLDKGYNVDTIFALPGIRKTTVLMLALETSKFWAIDLILDKKPDLFIRDTHGEYYGEYPSMHLIRYKKEDFSDNPLVLGIIHKYNALKEQQIPLTPLSKN